MHDATYTPPPRAMFGLHDTIDFLEGLDYDVSGLSNNEIMELMHKVLDGLNDDEDANI